MFLTTSRDESVYPKFTHWKNLKTHSIKEKNKFSRQILLDQISSKRKAVKFLRGQYTNLMNDLLSSTTLFESYVLQISMNHSVLKEEKKIIKRYRKKLDTLLQERDKNRGISTNLNTITEDEYDILQYGLEHGPVTRPEENDTLTYAEEIWEQIDKANIGSNNFHPKSKIKMPFEDWLLILLT